jgi:hypothetical protein
MSDNTENKRPTHAIYVIHGEGKKERWTKIGAAWQHKDKQGFSLTFEAYPAGTGRVALRLITEKDGEGNTTGNGGQQ